MREDKKEVVVNGLKCPRCGHNKFYEEHTHGVTMYVCSKCGLIVWIGRG